MRRSIVASSLLLSSFAHAAAPGEFDYPELLVTPKASERIEMEAGKEGSRRLVSQLPIAASGLATLVAGIAQLGNPDSSKDADGVTGLAGVTVGGGWLALSVALSAFSQPYSSAGRELSAMPRKTQREQLIRERYAEEAIKSQARLARRLKWLSVLTHLGANLYMLGKASPESFSQVADGVGAAVSLAPLVFRSNWEDVASEQEDYKKRIYAPVASAAVFGDGSGGIAPGLMLSMSF